MADNGGYEKPVLVSTDWLAEHLGDESVLAAEVDENPALYEEGHIPGAVKLHWRDDLQDPIERDIVEKEQFERLLGGLGISNDSTVVVYGDRNNWWAAYAYWLFKLYNHPDVRVMNGGRAKWIEEGREQSKEVPSYPKSTYPTPAVNVPWAQAVKEDGTFKSAEDLKQLYGGKGISADREVIAYCRIGERSAHTWFVLKELLGFPEVRNYDGSWTEWGNSVRVPVEKS